MDKIADSINFMFLAAGLLQGAVICLSIWKNREQTILSWLLIGFLFFLLCQIFLNGLGKMFVMPTLPEILYVLSYQVPLLISPFGYIYVKCRLLRRSSLELLDALLFIPFLYFFFLPASYYWFGLVLPRFLYYNVYADSVLQVSMHVLCMVRAYRIIKKQDPKKFILIWLKRFLLSTSIVGALIIIALKAMIFLPPDYLAIRFLFLILPLFVYWLTYKVLTYSLELEPGPPIKRVKKVVGERFPYSMARENQLTEVEIRFRKYLIEEKPYLKVGLTIDDIAETFKIPSYQITLVLNERIKKSFKDLINEYRIENAKELLYDYRFNGLTIAAISEESGFNCVSTFTILFKKSEGVTPSLYKPPPKPPPKRL